MLAQVLHQVYGGGILAVIMHHTGLYNCPLVGTHEDLSQGHTVTSTF